VTVKNRLYRHVILNSVRLIVLLLAVAVVVPAAAPQPASAQGVCFILFGCRPAPPVVTPTPSASDPCAPQPRRGSGSFVGIVSEDTFWDASSYRSCSLNEQGASGVDVMRQTFDWAQIEIARNRYDFSWYDALMADLARRRLGVLPIVFNAPRFRAHKRRSSRGANLPRRRDDFGRFAGRLARRYGPRGSFWRTHPDLPRMPVRAWQIWNEPNLRVYWHSGPSPRSYTRLLQTAARHIRKADRRAEIVSAGIAESRHGIPLAPFVAGMYRAGAKPAFDTLAINAFAARPHGVTNLTRRVRRLMDRHGDRGGAIRVTEFGWSTSGPRSRFRVTPEEQARRISLTLRGLYANRGRWKVRGVVYYNWRDGNPYPPLYQDFFGLHTGLLDAANRPKPGLRAFRKVALRLR
jgi:hypothetical protein